MTRGVAYGGGAVPARAHPVPIPAARPRPASAAVGSLVLGLVALATAPFLGGLVPGILAVTLAAAARREIAAAEGWLTGSPQAAAGRVLGWIAIWVAVTMAVTLIAWWLIGLGDAAVAPTYPRNVE